MKRFFIIICLIVFSVYMNPGALKAGETEQDTIPVYRMGEILVTANRLPVITTTSTKYIKSMEIEKLDIHNLSEALKFVPGLHVYRMSKNEVALNLRGFEQRQISVFLDGVPISVPYDGAIDLSQLSGDQLEEIRVARGSTSTLFGANTLGGSINLITADLTSSNKLYARIEGSTHEQYFGSLGYHHRIGRLNFSVNGNVSGGSGFILPDRFKQNGNEDGKQRDNSDFEKMYAGVKLQYDLTDRHKIGLNTHYLKNAYGIPPNTKTNTVRYWRFPEWQKNVFSLNSQHLFSENFLLRTVLFYDTYYNFLRSFDDNSYSTQNMKYAWNSVYDDYSGGLIIYPSLHVFSFGSTNLVLSHKRDIHREQFRDLGFDRYKMATSTAGLEQDIHISEKQAGIAGADINYLEPLTADGEDLRDPIWLGNGQLAYQYLYSPKIKLHGSLARKSRYPTLKELYSDRLGRTIPNPTLKAEYSYNTEIGVVYTHGQGRMEATFFYNMLHDLIMQRQLGNNTEQLQNIGRALIKGIELDVRTTLSKVSIAAGYTATEARNISADRPNSHLPYRPFHLFNLIADWRILNSLSGMLELTYVADNYYENPDNLRWEKFDNYTVINLKLKYLFNKQIQWYIRAVNLFDQLYENDYGVPMPGREFISGLRIRI